MNIITNADVEKFVKLFKAGIKQGNSKEMRVYSSVIKYQGTDIPKHYYISLTFDCYLSPEIIEALFIEEDAGLTNQINEMLK